MKKLIATTMAVLIIVTFVMAEEKEKVDKYFYCKQYSETAEGIMNLRQLGAPPEYVIEGLKKTGEIPAYIEDFIKDAYVIPKFENEKYQKKITQDFKNRAYIDCLRRY